MPGELSQFWKELKRRRVLKVMTVYAATAYIILEVGDIMLPRLGLPEWTVTLLIVLLIAGLPIALVLSWIFDITPEGLVKTESAPSESLEKFETPSSARAPKAIFRTSNIIIAILAVAVIILAYPRIFRGEKDPFEQAYGKLKPIAIFPFSNHTGDAAYDYLEYGISEYMINALSSSENIRVLDNQTLIDMLGHLENLEKASIGPDLAGKVASSLKVESYITGDFLLAGSILRIHLKQIDTRSSQVERSDNVEGPIDSLFNLVGTLSERIKNYLEIEVLGRSTEIYPVQRVSTTYPEAYRFYIQGLEKMWSRKGNAETDMLEAVRIDSSFTEAYFFLSLMYTSVGSFTRARECFLKADQGKGRLTGNMRLWHEAIRYGSMDKNPYRSIEILREVAEQDPLSRMNWLWLGIINSTVEQYRDALEACQQILSLNKKLGTWKNVIFYELISSVYMELGKYKEAARILKDGNEIFPESSEIKSNQAACALHQNDTLTARIYIDQYRNIMERSHEPDPMITAYIGNIYRSTGKYAKALELYRQALEARLEQGGELDTIQPGNHLFWYYVVIGNTCMVADENYDDAVIYLEKARELARKFYPDHPYILANLGYAYHKLGRHMEGYELLKKAEETSTQYNHRLHTYIREVEAAIKN